ncbi:MAG TPA: MmcQ/YjbR family DNA-binding protein [Polyangiaceae bacterium]|nr:MmcQ/YjbR family DNA-binding protein [Polyangiaceae bacterium]
MARRTHPHLDALLELRAFGLAYPQTHTKSPWPGHLDLAVRDKTFAYLSVEGEPLSISCKLPESGILALALPFVEPTGYGLGKSGWVTAKFSIDQTPPIEMLKEWIDESFRAQAPKRLAATVAAPNTRAVKATPNAAKKKPSRRATKR